MERGFFKRELRLAGSLLLAVPAAVASGWPMGATVTGIAAAAGMVSCGSILTNPVYVAQQLAQYVTLFIQTAQTVWATIAPLLGANQAADAAAFNDAVVALQNANGIMIDVAQAVAAGKTGNLPQAIQAVQDAVSRVMAVITQFQSSTPAAKVASEGSVVQLAHMSNTIQHWGQP